MARRKHVSPGVYIDEHAISNRRSRINEIPKMYLIEDDGIKPKHYTYMLKIIPNKSNIKVKETVQLQAMFYVVANNRKEKAEDVTKYCEWASNGKHITVNNNADKGLVTVQSKGGDVIITAIYKLDGETYSASAEISVKPDISYAFEVTPSTLHFMNTSETKSLTATYYKVTDGVNDSGTVVTERCEWSSNDDTKFSVTNGKVRAKKTGASGTITAKYGSYSDTASVSIESLVEHELVISATTSTTIELNGNNGGVKAIYYTIKDGVKDNGQDVTSSCTWNSSNPNNITVNKGTVIANKSGVSSSISATYNGVNSNSISFTVKSIEIYELIISPNSIETEVFANTQLTAKYIKTKDGAVQETDVTNDAIWYSTNSDITVNKGNVHPEKSGINGRVYATYNGLTSNNCEINVSSVITTSFAIIKKVNKLNKNGSYQLETQFVTNVDGVPNAEDVATSCTWSSSNPDAVSVSSTGKVTGLIPGESATITATYVRDGETYTDRITISVNDEITYRLVVDPTLITIDKDVPYEYVKAILYTVTNGVEDNGTEITNECTWKSSSNYIDVDKGVVTGLEYERSGYVEAIYTAPDNSKLSAQCNVTVNAEPKIPITAVFNVTGNTQILFNTTINIESVTWNGIDLLESTNGKITTANVDNGEQTIIFTLKDQDRITSSTFLGSCIKSIVFPEAIVDKLKIISNNAFSDCKYLEEFTVPKNVNQLGTEVFSGSTSLTTVVFDGNVLTDKTIPNQTFKGCTSLTSVTLPESYEKIGTSAFEGCYALPSITLSNDCKIIDYQAFYNCKNLETVEINEGLTTIGYSSFSTCSKLKNIVLPESLETIGDNGFNDCKVLENVAIHKNCNRIGASAYENCKGLNDLTIDEDGVDIIIDRKAFSNCDSLETVNIPNRVKEVGVSCFYDCDSLTTVTGLLGLTKINNSVFYGCDKLVNITLHSGIKSIGDSAFYDCNSLETTEDIIVEGVETIGGSAFYGCDTLDVIVSSTVNNIGYLAFTDLCDANNNVYCTTMYVNTGNTRYTSRDESGNECNCIMDYDRNTLYFGCNNTVIPDDVKIIYDYAFYYYNKFDEMPLPSGLTNINKYAFYHCIGLKNIVFPESLETIGERSFAQCSNIPKLHIPINVKYIGINAFYLCQSLNEITVDAGNTTYDSRNNSNCIMETSTDKLCFGCNNTVIPNDTKIIEDDACNGYVSLKNIVFPETLTRIGNSSFASCDSITELYIPANVTFIHENAFKDASNIKTIAVDAENTTYDSRDDGNWIVNTSENKLMLAANIDYTALSTSITKIGANAFYGNSIITEFEIHDNVTEIGNNAFYYAKLSKITIGSNVKSIGAWAFWNCTNLTEITLKPLIAPTFDNSTFYLTKTGTVYYPSGSDYSDWEENTNLKGWSFIPQ